MNHYALLKELSLSEAPRFIHLEEPIKFVLMSLCWDDFVVFKVSVQKAVMNSLSLLVEPELEIKEEPGKYMSQTLPQYSQASQSLHLMASGLCHSAAN